MENETIQPPIHLDGLTLALQKACVAAVYTNTVPHLIRSMQESGYPHVTETFVDFVGRDCAAMWGVRNPERKHCFHCGRRQNPEALCACIEGALPRDFVDLNDDELVAAQPADAPARSFLCSGCGQLSATSCGEVAKIQGAGKLFYPRKNCWRCHGASRAAQGRERRQAFEERAAKAQPKPQQAPKKPSQRPARTLTATLGEQLQAVAERIASPVAQA